MTTTHRLSRKFWIIIGGVSITIFAILIIFVTNGAASKIQDQCLKRLNYYSSGVYILNGVSKGFKTQEEAIDYCVRFVK